MSKKCPKCHQTYTKGKFCQDCGIPLVDEQPSVPQSSGDFSLNLGDANAISGGVNMSDNHSVNNNSFNTTTSNVDSHNVITNNITQVEREKTPEELKHEREFTFREECLKAYRNGIMTSDERRKLEDVQFRLGLDEISANRILSDVAKRSKRKSSTLSPAYKIIFENIKKAIKANSLDSLNHLMTQLKAMVQRYSVEDIQYTYYMLQAVLHPKECTEEYENRYEDNYWQTFWSSIAYRRIGNIEKSVQRFNDIETQWVDSFPSDNGLILASINALLDKNIYLAKSLLSSVGYDYSENQDIWNLLNCLNSILYENELSPEDLKQMQKDGAFYTSNLFAEINAYNFDQKRLKEDAKRLAEEKKRQEEAKAKRLVEEKKRQEEAEAKRFTEEKKLKEEVEVKRHSEDSIKQETSVSKTKFDPQLLKSFTNEFGYLRQLNTSEITELKPVLLSAPEDNYQAMFCLGQLYIQEKTSASNLRLAYNAIKTASEHGVYEAGSYLAYFYLYGKVVTQDLEEAERRIRIDDDYKKNPIFVQMLVDLYNIKGNSMLADVWKSKLSKLK